MRFVLVSLQFVCVCGLNVLFFFIVVVFFIGSFLLFFVGFLGCIGGGVDFGLKVEFISRL